MMIDQAIVYARSLRIALALAGFSDDVDITIGLTHFDMRRLKAETPSSQIEITDKGIEIAGVEFYEHQRG